MKGHSPVPDLADLVALVPPGRPAVAALCLDGSLDKAIETARRSLGDDGHLVACVARSEYRQARKRLAAAGLETLAVHAWVPTPRYRVLIVPTHDTRMLRFAMSLHFPGDSFKRIAACAVASLVRPGLLAPYLLVSARLRSSRDEVVQ